MNKDKYIAELEEKIAYLEEIISTMPGHVYWKDKTGLMLGCNDEQAQSVGLKSRKDIIGKSAIDLIDDNQDPQQRMQQAKAIEEADRKVIESNKPIVLEEKAMLPDGTEGSFISKKVPIHDVRGNVKGLVGVTLDITKIKRLENQIQNINKTKSRFILDVATIIREPLGSIYSSIQVLSKTKLSKLQKECVEIITDSSKSMIPIIDRFYDYVSLEDKELAKPKSTVDLKSFFDEIIAGYPDYIQQKGLKLNYEYDITLAKNAEGSFYFISQVFRNILSNAVRHTQTGSIDISIVKKYVGEKGDFGLSINISDTGQGIREGVLKNIFGLFDREDMTNENFTNAGIALSISKKMLDLIGGTICITSEINQGTSVQIDVPLTEASSFADAHHDELSNKLLSKEAFIPIKRKKRLSIFVIEDNLIAQRAFKVMLEEEFNCTVTQAFGLNDALQHVNDAFDIVFTDINLPDGTGIDFLKEFKKTGRKTPVIAVTSHVTEEQKEVLFDSGMADVIVKPIDLTVLSDTICYYLYAPE